MVLGRSLFKIVSDCPANHLRWLLLLKIEISIVHCCFIVPLQGRIRGGGQAAPLKLDKNVIFLAKNRDFSHEIPQKFSRLPPLGEFFFNCTPPYLEILDPSLPYDSLKVDYSKGYPHLYVCACI